jgi:hypothetical protein
MKKIVYLLVALVIFISSGPYVHASENESKHSPVVYLDGKKLEFETPPVNIDGFLLVPMRKIFEELGAYIHWDDEAQTVTVISSKTIFYTIGQDQASINYYTYDLPVPGRIINGSTMVPLRFMAEALGAIIDWEPVSKTIAITTERDYPPTYSGAVTKVSDSGIIEIKQDPIEEGGTQFSHNFRLIGAAAIGDPESGQNTSYGDYIKTSLMNKRVKYIIKHPLDADWNGVQDVYLHLEDGGFFNAHIIAAGYAQEKVSTADQVWANMFKSLTSDAIAQKRGAWKSIPTASVHDNLETAVTITNQDRLGEVVTIKNTGTLGVDLSDWKLVSIRGNETFIFPKGYVLGADESVNIVSGKDAIEGAGRLFWTFTYVHIDEKSDPVELYNASGIKISDYR